MAILSKEYKPDNSELHNSLNFSFTNIRSLRLNFAECESFLQSNSLTFLLYVRQIWMTQRILYYSYAWSCIFCERTTFFCTRRISRKLCGFLLMFSTGFTSISVLLLFSSIDHPLRRCARFLILFHLT